MSRKPCSSAGSGRKSKISKREVDTDSDSSTTIVDFHPASIVDSRDGTLMVPNTIKKYLDRHLKHWKRGKLYLEGTPDQP